MSTLVYQGKTQIPDMARPLPYDYGLYRHGIVARRYEMKEVDFVAVGFVDDETRPTNALSGAQYVDKRVRLTFNFKRDNNYIWEVGYKAHQKKDGDFYWQNFAAKAERQTSYRNRHTLRGMEYTQRYRGIWNPEHDDEISNLFQNGAHSEIKQWLTDSYCELWPHMEAHFKNSRFHTPPMAYLAIKYPGYAMMTRAGWSPTIPYSPNEGIFRTMLSQPNPKRLINYIYGNYSKAHFKHLSENMKAPNNWFALWATRMGREFFPGEWAHEIKVPEGAEVLQSTPLMVPSKIRWAKEMFNGIKSKRLLELFIQAAESRENLELFWDSLNLTQSINNINYNQYHNEVRTARRQNAELPAQPQNILTQFDIRYLDELHTRLTERHNELRPQYNWVRSRASWTDDTDLKVPDKFKEIQDKTIDLGIEVRVAEKAGEVAEWGRVQEHCIASYIPQAVNGQTTLMGFYKDGKIIANASVSGRMITQLRGYRNRTVPPEEQDAIRKAVERVIA